MCNFSGPTLPHLYYEIPLVSTSKGLIFAGGTGVKIVKLQCQENQVIEDCIWINSGEVRRRWRMKHFVIPLPISYDVPCDNDS